MGQLNAPWFLVIPQIHYSTQVQVVTIFVNTWPYLGGETPHFGGENSPQEMSRKNTDCLSQQRKTPHRRFFSSRSVVLVVILLVCICCTVRWPRYRINRFVRSGLAYFVQQLARALWDSVAVRSQYIAMLWSPVYDFLHRCYYRRWQTGKNAVAAVMGVASNRQKRQLAMPLLGFCKIKNDQADQLFSLQKTKRRQTVYMIVHQCRKFLFQYSQTPCGRGLHACTLLSACIIQIGEICKFW